MFCTSMSFTLWTFFLTSFVFHRRNFKTCGLSKYWHFGVICHFNSIKNVLTVNRYSMMWMKNTSRSFISNNKCYMNWKRQCFMIQQRNCQNYINNHALPFTIIAQFPSGSAAESHKQDQADWLVQIMFFGCIKFPPLN